MWWRGGIWRSVSDSSVSRLFSLLVVFGGWSIVPFATATLIPLYCSSQQHSTAQHSSPVVATKRLELYFVVVFGLIRFLYSALLIVKGLRCWCKA